MKRTLSAVAAAVLVSMMALMFLGGLLRKAARVVDGLRNAAAAKSAVAKRIRSLAVARGSSGANR
jgi:hypothetical protein